MPSPECNLKSCQEMRNQFADYCLLQHAASTFYPESGVIMRDEIKSKLMDKSQTRHQKAYNEGLCVTAPTLLPQE